MYLTIRKRIHSHYGNVLDANLVDTMLKHKKQATYDFRPTLTQIFADVFIPPK